MLTVTFTGHRPDKIGGYKNEDSAKVIFVKNWIEEVTRRIIEKFGDVTFISGGAQGVDLWAAEIIMKHKDTYKDKNIKLILAIPCPEFGDKWPVEAKKVLKYYKSLADEWIYVRDSYTSPLVLDIRNKWVVDRASLVIAVWDGSLGGTRNCVKYAMELKRRIWRLNPINCETIKY